MPQKLTKKKRHVRCVTQSVVITLYMESDHITVRPMITCVSIREDAHQ